MIENERSHEQHKSDEGSMVIDMHPADIVCLLKKRCISLRDLDRQHGYAPGAIGQALHRPWPLAERIIAEAIGMRPEDVWPARYMHRSRRDASRAALRARRVA